MKKPALAFALAFALASPMLASGGEAKSVSVQVSDLNLSSDAGVQALYSRIQGAAREACRGAESRSAATQVEHRTCMRTAIESGVMAANNASLTKLHAAKMGETAAVVAEK